MNRLHTVDRKISHETTGLRGSLFVHVDHDDNGFIHGVRISHKSKEKDNTLDTVFTALGDAITEIVTTKAVTGEGA